MPSVAAGLKAMLSSGRRAIELVKTIESSAALTERFKESAEEIDREIGQVSYAVCRALIAHALAREPSEAEVSEVLTAAINDPAFPARAYRLLGEAKKAASRRRRAFLASALFGLQFSKRPDDERDMVDMALERMTVEEAEFLIVLRESRSNPTGLGTVVNHFGPHGMIVLISSDGESEEWQDVFVATPGAHGGAEGGGMRTGIERSVFDSLRLLGCIELGHELPRDGSFAAHHLLVTVLGEMVTRAIIEVRPGFTDLRR